MNKFQNLSIIKKVSVILTAIFVFVLLILASIISYFHQSASVGTSIDLAGRQRMISQRIGFYAEQVLNGNSDAKSPLLAMIELHDKSIEVLLNGGEAPKMNTKIKLKPVPEDIKETVNNAMELWEQYKTCAETIANSGEINTETEDAIKFLETNGPDMLERNDAIVKALVLKSNKNISMLTIKLYIFLFIIGGIIYFAFLTIKSTIVDPINRIKNYAYRISNGDLNATIDCTQHDEIGQLCDSIVSMEILMNQLINVGTAIRVVDRDYNIILQNEAMCDLTNTSCGQYLGKKCYDQLSGPACHNEHCTLDNIVNGELKIHGEIEKNRPDGTKIPTMVTALPFTNSKGEVLGVIEAFTDISTIKEKEKTVLTIAQKVSNVTDKINQSVYDISTSAESIKAGTIQVSQTIKEIATGASDQSAQVGEAAHHLEVITTSIRQIADFAQSSAEESSNANIAAQAGVKAAQAGEHKMKSISTAVVNSAETIQELGRKTQEIDQIISVINQISNQTNLLALNAAIEAARAGEAGKGFAVVADEVRKLAEKSSEATKQIADLIATIQSETSKAVDSMDIGVKEVEEGAKVINDALESLEQIGKAIAIVANKAEDISASSEEQVAQSSMAQNSINNIAAVSQESAAASEEVSASVEDTSNAMGVISDKILALSELSMDLQALVDKLK